MNWKKAALIAAAAALSISAENPKNEILENFETRALKNFAIRNYSDKSDGGASAIKLSYKDDDSRYVSIDYSLDRADYEWDPYINMALQFNDGCDAGEYEGISYRYRGDAHSLVVEIDGVEDYCWHESSVRQSDGWRTVQISFERDLAQPTWGKRVPFSPKEISGISWRVMGETGEAGTIDVDDITFVRSMPYVMQNNMKIKNAEVPAKVNVASAKRKTDLQKRVDNYLSRGINLHNWLEEDEEWDGVFEYNRETIHKYAKQGFTAVRFPIDLDRWVVDRDDVVAGKKEFSIDSTLFAILDSMYLWTEETKMALTIDYHQYDKSLNRKTVVDPGYRKMVSNLWKSVAHYYAKEKREDLFFELTNEPGIMDEIANTLWREMAGEMLDSIRTVNKFNSVIYGDSRWYDIDKLVNNELFAPKDGNVIYAFHFYEPFIFTHQGADWAEQGSTGNVPFPYSEEKWSTEYRDFGIADGTPEWVKDEYQNYFKTGNRNAMFNAVAEVKNWAVKNNAAVVCNELGAYEKSSNREDLVNYFNVIGDIFSELGIGYGIWYGIFDEKEDLIPGVAENLGLNK